MFCDLMFITEMHLGSCSSLFQFYISGPLALTFHVLTQLFIFELMIHPRLDGLKLYFSFLCLVFAFGTFCCDGGRQSPC